MVKNLITRSDFAAMAGVSGAAITKACSKSLAGAVDGKRIDLNSQAAQDYLERQTKPPPKIGVDALYEEAVNVCKDSNNYTMGFLRKLYKIGHHRAKRIVDTMQLNGVIPEKIEEPEELAEEGVKKTQITIKHVRQPHVRGPAAAKQNKKNAEGETPLIFEIPKNIEAFVDMTLRDIISKFGTDVRFCDWLNATKAIEDINAKRLKNAETKGDLVSRKLVRDAVIAPIDTCHRRLLSDGARSLSIRVPAMHDAGEDAKKIEKYIHDQIGSFIRPMKNKVSKALRNVGGEEK